ncbi:hypothetical protein THZG08_50027 [Vibrio owensii]|nr:hypothetical protein THZG08_50027 [Vibrio owensii]CAH1581880.1 hypothetical protein THOA03_50026 [Vibrio owensii]
MLTIFYTGLYTGNVRYRSGYNFKNEKQVLDRSKMNIKVRRISRAITF